MISFPLSLRDISLWLAIMAIMLLITSEMLSPYYGKINIQVNRKKLRIVALVVSILFLVTLVIDVAMNLS
jgi:uncharacterized membrane protein